jgi:hypothetical protein
MHRSIGPVGHLAPSRASGNPDARDVFWTARAAIAAHTGLARNLKE